MDLSKIPFLKNLDMSNPQTRKSVIMLGVAAAAVIVLLVMSLSSGKPKQEKTVDKQESTVPPIQTGEDKDALEKKTIIDLREKRRSDNGDFARRMFEDAGGVENILTDASSDGKEPSASGDNAEGAPAAAPSSSGPKTNPFTGGGSGSKTPGASIIEQAMRMADEDDARVRAQFGIPQESEIQQAARQQEEGSRERAGATPQSSGQGSDAMSVEERVNKKQNEIRSKVRSQGYDPDTYMPIEQYGEQSESNSQETPPASSVLHEGIEKASVSVRGRGSMSSFGSGPSTSSGSGFSSFGSAEQEAVASGAKFFKVAFGYTEKVKTGQRVILRTKEKITVDGFELPLNSILYANCSIKDDRLIMTVRNVDINGKAYYLNYTAVDIDWEDGLYCPNKKNSAKTKQALREAGQLVSQTVSGAIGGFGSRVISSGASMVQNSNGDITVTVTEGYEFYLVPAVDSSFASE